MGVTLELAKRAVETRFEDIPKNAVESAKDLLVNFVGISAAGGETSTGKTVVNYVVAMEAKAEATIITNKVRTVAPYAAYANATLCHCNEMEDVGMRGSFAASHLLASALAMGEKMGACGKEVLASYILGHQVQGSVSIACLPSSAKRISPWKYGFLGCATVAGRLMKLSVDGVAMSIALAASQASGLAPTTGTTSHYLEFRSAARSGIESALLVADGITARTDILEGEHCFCDELVGQGDYDLDQMTAEWDKTWHCTQVSIKKYTCCYVSHRPLDSLLDIMKENNISFADIEGVDVEVSHFHTNWMRFDEPTNADEARFSLKHVMAAAILQGEVWVESFTDEAVADPKYQEARRKINVILHPEWPSTRDKVQAIVTVKLRDGRVFTREASELREPSRAELINNYKRLTQPVLSPLQQERSLELMFNIEKCDSIFELMNILGLRV